MNASVDVVATLAALSGALAPFTAAGVGLLGWILFKVERRLYDIEKELKRHGTEERSQRRAA